MYYQTILLREFERRKKMNPRYSLRAYSKALGVTIATISRVLSGKRELTADRASAFAEILKLTTAEKKKFISSVITEKKRVKKDASYMQSLDQAKPLRKVGKLSQDQASIISEWHHYAILQLTVLDAFQSDPKWIADRLGISVKMAQDSIELLKKLNLMEESEDGTLRKTNLYLVNDDLASTKEALKKHQQKFLETSMVALKNVPIQERSHSSYMIAVDPAKLPRVKEFITEFAADVSEIASNEAKKRLYWLGVSLFPLDQE